MISRIHQKLGTAGFVISIVALIAALGGTAWAAAGLNGKQKNEVTAIAKKYAGKKGAKGAKGDTGATGATGAAGLPGAAGKDGAKGADGTAGTAGKSIETGIEATGTANCEGRGGTWVQPEGVPASRKYACTGKEGSFSSVLPSGKSLAGTWGTFSEVAGISAAPISFSAAMATVPEAIVVKKGKIGIDNPTKCPGYVSGTATAAAGVLCIYVSNETGGTVDAFFDPTAEEAAGASKQGAVLFLGLNGSGPLFGTWAVKAP
jgi:hypothetical protein